MTDKIRIASITIARAEGRREECISRTFDSRTHNEDKTYLEQANTELARWARTAPDSGGYDKCDFTVTWVDGETYEGRFDLVRRHIGGGNLIGVHMENYLLTIAGAKCPSHMESRRYGSYLRSMGYDDPKKRQGIVDWLAKYDIGLEAKTYELPPIPDDVDARDLEIRAKRMELYERRDGPRVGDYVRFAGGTMARISATDIEDDYFQPAGSNQRFYLGNGFIEFSGSLLRPMKRSTLVLTEETRSGSVWFFHHDFPGAGQGVDTTIPFRVYTSSEAAPT